MNLLNNAINYSKPNGTCTITSYPLGDQLVVEVSDDGIGISAEHLPRQFERFYRVGKSRARNESGSGPWPGHRQAHHRCTRTNDAVKAEGKGTTFTFTLQRAD